MRNTQNNSLVLIQENQVGVPLRDEVSILIESLQARENTINKKRCTRDDRAYWIARGRRQIVRQVSAQLLAIQAAYVTSYTLYLALHEYLACLDKYSIDVEDEQQAAKPRNGRPIEQWKAEGEVQELPRIARVLLRMVQAHTPDAIHHTLSLNGKHLVSLRCGSDEPFLTCEESEQTLSSEPLPVLEWAPLPADLHAASELALARSERGQESASLPRIV